MSNRVNKRCGPPDECIICGEIKPILGGGKCSKCYGVWYYIHHAKELRQYGKDYRRRATERAHEERLERLTITLMQVCRHTTKQYFSWVDLTKVYNEHNPLHKLHWRSIWQAVQMSANRDYYEIVNATKGRVKGIMFHRLGTGRQKK